MSHQPEFDPERLNQAMENLRNAAINTGHTLTVQAAMGWVMRGDLAKACESLQRLPADKLLEVSAAAAALSSLADELATGTQP
ncbi:hypothetical protein [Nocardia cyriacigeorgica]|uniref:hypothetical protein n=1 Tax=Nocardia cyriacigeorgica TaxID=135487 RepID=UPI0018936DF9|nr:hypothetical protein [Nocardia cyriacigeorgica]MBF6416940.1 hypothetical protein [Nocardia cyriacigeorgica]